MPLIKPKILDKKTLVRVNILNSTLEEIAHYCAWAKIAKQDDFFEQAAQFVFQKDKDWKKQISSKQ